MTHPAPGWYPDATDPNRQRYFDGYSWTENYAPLGTTAPGVLQPAKHGLSKGMKLGVTIGGVGLVMLALGSIGNSKPSSPAATTTTVMATVAEKQPTPQPTRTEPMTVIDGDGTYLVGRDIVPGQYRSAGGAGGRSDCYWERLSGLGGSFSEIIANDRGEGQRVVEILPSDVAFQTEHCKPWEHIG